MTTFEDNYIAIVLCVTVTIGMKICYLLWKMFTIIDFKIADPPGLEHSSRFFKNPMSVNPNYIYIMLESDIIFTFDEVFFIENRLTV